MGEKISANDGGGLFDSIGLIDTLIVDVNALPKKLMCGEYVGFCARVVEIVQKLGQLKIGVQKDTQFLKDRVAEYAEYINKIEAEKTQTGEEHD